MKPIISIVIASFLLACGAQKPPPPPVEVEVATVDAPTVVEFLGVVKTRDSTIVTAEFEALVTRIYVREGQRVKKGDPIVSFDDTQVKDRLRAATAAAEAAGAEKRRAGVSVRQAKRAVTREKRLFLQGAVSRERTRGAHDDRSAASAAHSSAAAHHRKALAEKKQFSKQLKKATLYATIDGVVSQIRVKEGEMARPGTTVARVFDLRDLTATFAFDQNHRDAIKAGTSIEATIPTTGATFQVSVESVSKAPPPHEFLVAEADIDDSSLKGSDVTAGESARFRIVAP